ncbi:MULTISPECIES: hypothetical protein [Pseudomonas]|jgi:hypothetical protein|uniref:Uncharacterized protein n=2 Tax=Pseudomonas TaxID=286 RepID=A0A1L7NA06_PSEPU|nr:MULTISPECIES: hypothetical protein [Pseudomonas]AGN78400.1 hypothetical protein L483_07640 [Pseudomonas putida H8234]EKT4450435.1 hypothetical protein [Pseudomonas putida]EKT4563153.1 hypothetical protein [Pseudomonas putida]MBH3451981.1 hypothetical protein [Pseudomonas putida]MBH3470800.1 hypothetical protein [Pseudomonas putida]
MQINTALLFATPCDDEEDNMATLCCHSDKGQMFLLTRYPDEDTVDLTLDDEPSTLDGLKVTLSAKRLLIEVAAGDQDALKGDEVLEIHLTSDLSDLDEVKQTLENILTGTGTFVCEL